MVFQIPRDASLELVRELFSRDRFAVESCGCEILEAAEGHAVCALELADRHLNANDLPMGGAIFTLADFCLGIASNYNQVASVTTSSTIDYLSVAGTRRLIARANADKMGKTLGFFTVEVHDSNDLLVARMTAICTRVG
ncbi:MAG: PaaI family thioesterase [Coriobacteriales bacterium]|nr:PaaI family thioesterase [Coriobacteriales bacterium]